MDKGLEPEEKHIVDESPEISVGESPGWARALASAFPALRVRDYQLYFIGQFISLVGTWVQIVAEGWLVVRFTWHEVVHDPAYVRRVLEAVVARREDHAAGA